MPEARVPLSVLDLAPIREGSGADEALRQSLELAPIVERLGYSRIWVAEHHNIPGVASSATSVLIGALASVTAAIRVGSGGIMLPNHAPLVIAEQFGTLEALYPGRIDLGLGRAPGTDHVTGWALRRNPNGGVQFDAEVEELRSFLAPETGPTRPRVRAVPGAGSGVPVWILGSSLYGAELAARLGLPYAFASHFAPRFLDEAAALYRERFVPSEALDRPYFMMGVSLLAADDDAAARWAFSSTLQKFAWLTRGAPKGTLPPLDDAAMERFWTSDGERAAIEAQMALAVVGGPSTVASKLSSLVERVGADEVIVASDAYDFGARVRSYEVLAETWGLAQRDGSRSDSSPAATVVAENSMTS
ncbi:MAG TPA: LLM class flavin-dependent oxidoreductase [Baekduia sp.]|uniref:LLM class flavin-dependent oxidoreductase n=1 Tax=Baekduia sp. TaxID=2600305 RepID=UPI002D7A1B38|nr:LLM class flavin-dependent oxidoreductase [Baekduia sp.]HET6508772.1 LLM class flavin-dependent oxidoreductase [Baekduia sp.]